MDRDDDLLPTPPPPDPRQRAAAIGEALRQFDRQGQNARPAPDSKPATWWSAHARPQLTAIAAVLLVALIAVPAWFTAQRRDAGSAPVARVATATGPGHDALTAAPADVAPAPPAAAPQAPAARAPAPAAPASKPASPAQERSPPTVSAPLAMVAPPAPLAPAPVAPPPPAMIAAEPEGAGDVVVTGSRLARAPTRRAERADGEIVGTARATDGGVRGDWNYCTVDDPARSLAACRTEIDPGAPGAGGREAAELAAGLTRAWSGDQDGAIAAFDRAIAIAPGSAAAHLNRGLLRANRGDLAGAHADLDRAVRAAPTMARGYYLRAQLQRRRGKHRAAEADEARAVALDPDYRAALR